MNPEMTKILNLGEKIKKKEITGEKIQGVDIEETEAVQDTTIEVEIHLKNGELEIIEEKAVNLTAEELYSISISFTTITKRSLAIHVTC